MDKKLMKKLVLGTAMLIFAGCMVGCGSNDSAKSNKAANDATVIKGKISLAGSTSMEKLCEAMSESFMAANPGVTVNVEYTGSGAGIESLVAGSVDIGNASRGLKAGEKEKGAVENIVAIDGIAVIVDKENIIKNLSTTELMNIYKGNIKNWKELGGKNEAIVVLGRENGSGTRGAFEELLKVKDNCKYAQELDSTGGVLAKVAATPGAIGYVSLDVVNSKVKSLEINGVEANKGNILAGKYLLSRPFVMATKGKISSQNLLVKKWFAYISSVEGKKVISSQGLILPK